MRICICICVYRNYSTTDFPNNFFFPRTKILVRKKMLGIFSDYKLIIELSDCS